MPPSSVVVAFNSRGPNLGQDVMGPGVKNFAAWSEVIGPTKLEAHKACFRECREKF